MRTPQERLAWAQQHGLPPGYAILSDEEMQRMAGAIQQQQIFLRRWEKLMEPLKVTTQKDCLPAILNLIKREESLRLFVDELEKKLKAFEADGPLVAVVMKFEAVDDERPDDQLTFSTTEEIVLIEEILRLARIKKKHS